MERLGLMRVAVTRPLPGTPDFGGASADTAGEGGFGDAESLHAFLRGPDGAGCDAAVTWVSERVDAGFLEACGATLGGGGRLKLVANFAVGYDNVDVQACRDFGVRLSNTPDAVTAGTAELAVTLLLAASRRVIWQDRFARSGAWAEHGVLGPAERITLPIAGRTLLIVGAGRIGYATAVRMLGFGVRVLYVARTAKPLFEDAPLCARRVTLEEGLREADLVSVHVPLSDETRHLIGAPELALMKPSAVLVNTARGPIVDEAALVEALRSEQIYGAGLDVFEREPAIHEGLVGLENAVLSPHVGSASETSRAAMTDLVCANVRAVLGGGEPVTPVV